MRRLDGKPKRRTARQIWMDIPECLHRELQAFKGCHNRVKAGKSPNIDFSRDPVGFYAWLADIGRMPVDMMKPSCGRKFHDFGYISGNLQWEEHAENSRKRHGTRYEAVSTMECTT